MLLRCIESRHVETFDYFQELFLVVGLKKFLARKLHYKSRAANQQNINHLLDQNLVERTELTQIVHQPTRGANILDRVYVSSPQLFSTVRVVASTVKSDHKAVVAFQEGNQ